MRAYLCPQYSPSWWELRAGLPTASDFDRILTPSGDPSKQQTGYIDELIRTALGWVTPTAFSANGRMGTPAMEAGRATEPEARAFYSMYRGVKVHEVGLVKSPCDRFGCSPDGLVNPRSSTVGRDGQGRRWVECTADGGLELKAPLPKTQEQYLKKPNELPLRYKPQVHGQLITMGLPWIDFCSYCKGHDPVLVRVYPDDYTLRLRAELEIFLAKLDWSWRWLLDNTPLAY